MSTTPEHLSGTTGVPEVEPRGTTVTAPAQTNTPSPQARTEAGPSQTPTDTIEPAPPTDTRASTPDPDKIEVIQRTRSPGLEDVPQFELPQLEFPRSGDRAVDLAGLEEGTAAMPTYVKDWIAQGAPADSQFLRSVTASREMTDDVGALMVRSAIEHAEQHRRDDPRPWYHPSNTTAGMSLKNSPEFRDAWKNTPLFTGQRAASSPPMLDFLRDTIISLKDQIGDFGKGGDGLEGNADLPFMKQQVTKSLEEIIPVLGATAYSRTLGERGGDVARVAAAVAVSQLGFFIALTAKPMQAFYLTALAFAQAQTLPVAAGMIRNPAITSGMHHDLTVERAVPWATVPTALLIPAILSTFSTDTHNDGRLKSVAEKAEKVAAHPAFETLVGLTIFAIYQSGNYPERARNLLKSMWQKADSQDARFRRGAMRIHASDADTPQDRVLREKIERFRNTFLLVTSLARAQSVFQDVWQGKRAALEAPAPKPDEGSKRGKESVRKHEKLPTLEQQRVGEINSKLENVATAVDRTVGGVAGQVELTSPEQSRVRKTVGNFLVPIAVAVGGVTSAAAKKSPSLLVDDVPYFLCATLALYTTSRDRARSVFDLTRKFGSLMGATMMQLPVSIANTVTELKYNEGVADIVHSKAQGPSKGYPNFYVTEHPALHRLDGKLNFGILTSANVLLSLTVAGETGKWIANGVMAALRAVSTSPPAADGSRRTPGGELPGSQRAALILKIVDDYLGRMQQQTLAPSPSRDTAVQSSAPVPAASASSPTPQASEPMDALQVLQSIQGVQAMQVPRDVQVLPAPQTRGPGAERSGDPRAADVIELRELPHRRPPEEQSPSSRSAAESPGPHREAGSRAESPSTTPRQRERNNPDEPRRPESVQSTKPPTPKQQPHR